MTDEQPDAGVEQAWACLGLGANLGDREANLKAALSALEAQCRVTAWSSWYETDPVGFTDQPAFLNAAVCVRTGLTPHELLRFVQDIERRAGRTPTFRNGPRVLDIDILLYEPPHGGHFVMRSDDLSIPHPRMAERAFVLVPVAELIPDRVHPVLNETMRALRDTVGTEGVKPWPESGDSR